MQWYKMLWRYQSGISGFFTFPCTDHTNQLAPCTCSHLYHTTLKWKNVLERKVGIITGRGGLNPDSWSLVYLEVQVSCRRWRKKKFFHCLQHLNTYLRRWMWTFLELNNQMSVAPVRDWLSWPGFMIYKNFKLIFDVMYRIATLVKLNFPSKS